MAFVESDVAKKQEDKDMKKIWIMLILTLSCCFSAFAQIDANSRYYGASYEEIRELERRKDAGDAMAQYEYANYLYSKSSIKSSSTTDLAISMLYQKAANQNLPQAQVALGDWNYYGGIGIFKDVKDRDKAIEWYKKAAAQGYDVAIQKLRDLGVDWNNNYQPVNNSTTIALLSATSTSSTSYELRVGIKSPSQIRDKYVYVNGSLQRAIDVVKNDGFDMEIGQDVSLHEGNNTIRIEIINASGTTSKEFAVYVSTSTHSISPSEKRIALVIGISNYRNTSRLRNTINDANAMESKLRQCGFTVIKRTDLQTASEIQNVINDFGAQARNGYDVALFFYAGHGINYNNESWIVPTLASIQCAEQIPNVCANAGWIMDATSGVKNRIVIFDACRNLPGIKDCNNASRDIEGHITPGITSFRKGGGAFVAYACSQGETSGDGPIGGNGIYTGELLKILDKPNMNILDVFSETATNVHNKTNATQNPWNTSAFYGKFIFNRQ